MSARRSISLSAAVLLLLSTATPAASDPAGTGESWEVTSQMTVPGMPMRFDLEFPPSACSGQAWRADGRNDPGAGDGDGSRPRRRGP